MIFKTQKGLVVPAVNTDQMRKIDRIAIEETGPSLLQMMENAGRSLALMAMDLMGEHWPNAAYLVLAGKGGNGGGTICAARHLKNLGLEVALSLTQNKELSIAAQKQLNVFLAAGRKIINHQDLNEIDSQIIIDGLIDYSLRGKLEGQMAKFIQWANQQHARKLALDIPSGIDANSGRAPGLYFVADITLTLALPKTGLQNPHCGRLIFADIGIPERCFKLAGIKWNSQIWDGHFCIGIFRQI